MPLPEFDDNDDYANVDHLLENGWWASEQVDEVQAAIKALCSEKMYEDGKKDNGIAVRFLARMTALKVAAGIMASNDPMAIEAANMFAAKD
jgi:phage gp36-like protein